MLCMLSELCIFATVQDQTCFSEILLSELCSYHRVFLSFSLLSNMKKLSDQLRSSDIEKILIPSFDYSNPSSVALEDYSAWFKEHGHRIPGNFTECDLEKEMQKVKVVRLLQGNILDSVCRA